MRRADVVTEAIVETIAASLDAGCGAQGAAGFLPSRYCSIGAGRRNDVLRLCSTRACFVVKYTHVPSNTLSVSVCICLLLHVQSGQLVSQRSSCTARSPLRSLRSLHSVDGRGLRLCAVQHNVPHGTYPDRCMQ
jgi:hypothetical protein